MDNNYIGTILDRHDAIGLVVRGIPRFQMTSSVAKEMKGTMFVNGGCFFHNVIHYANTASLIRRLC